MHAHRFGVLRVKGALILTESECCYPKNRILRRFYTLKVGPGKLRDRPFRFVLF